MMEVSSYKFHRRASTALHQLTKDEQAQVLETLAVFMDTPVAQWPAEQVKRLPGDQSLYLVRINESLRAFVQAIPGQEPVVMDLVRHEALEFFTRAATRNGV